MAATPIKIRSLPGIKRDGTRLEGDYYVDGQWCRFQRALPRKIGGYFSVAQDLQQLIYGMHSYSSGGSQYFHLGSESQLQQRVLNAAGIVTGSNDRTPAGLVSDPDNIWQMDAIFDIATANDTVLVAHAAPNMDISSQTTAKIWYGVITAGGLLIDTTQTEVSGGILVVGNYLVGFGNGGQVQWSNANDVVSATLDSLPVTQQKIVAGKRIRGGGVPAALLWSLDSLLQMTFSNQPAPAPLWDFDTITDDTSILSSRCPIEYDGIFYWMGVDRPLSYNGVVREVRNDLNVNFFYDNLNFEQRQKVYAYKVPRFGEIWWCYPSGSNTECNHAIIYNVREQSWYDTELPNEGRTDGLYAKVTNKPYMMGAEQTSGGYDLWQQETGANQVRLGVTEPIPAHFETHEFSIVAAEEKPQNKALRIERLEPDFVQTGDMTLTVRGRTNSRSKIYDSAVFTITEPADELVGNSVDEQQVPLKENRRLMSFKFESNTEDGFFQMGEVLGHIEDTDGRVTQ